uniref:SET domain-containing protein n=1 Tax=Paramoeba aestuarina TaxID=180227 RepID=A0A7S4KGG1_9EUKA
MLSFFLSFRDAMALIGVKDFGEKGRGVVALKNFSRGDLVEEAHCIYFPKNEVELANRTTLREYTFVAGEGLLLALNYGSLFNHSNSPNIDYRVDQKERKVRFFAAKEILEGDELNIFYGHNLWFKEPDTSEKEKEEYVESSLFGQTFDDEEKN